MRVYREELETRVAQSFVLETRGLKIPRARIHLRVLSIFRGYSRADASVYRGYSLLIFDIMVLIDQILDTMRFAL